MPCIGNTVTTQTLECLRIDGVAYLLSTSSGRVNLKTVKHPLLSSQVLEDKLGHHTTADITMADKEYPMHTFCN